MGNSNILDFLKPATGQISMVLDTDAYNEIDDQFALVYALLSKDKIKLEAVYAAPFYADNSINDRSVNPEDGMEKSYNEIVRILGLMTQIDKIPVFKGSTNFLKTNNEPVDSDAVEDLIDRAMQKRTEPLYVVGIAAATNIASAIIKEPRIIKQIVVVWLGGNPHSWHTACEFNLLQDLKAAQILFDSGVPLVHVPCKNVAEHLTTSVPELDKCIRGRSEIGDYLYDSFAAYNEDHYAWTKEIWDVANIAWLVNPDWTSSAIVTSPILTDEMLWNASKSRHFVREIRDIRRNMVFKDMFKKLEKYAEGEIQI